MLNKVLEILNDATNSVILTTKLKKEDFDSATILPATLNSYDLGITAQKEGLKSPKWFYDIVKNGASKTIIIDKIDSVDEYNQEKFYELIKYKTISGVALPKECKIIVLASDIKKVNQNIKAYCKIID